MWSTFQANGKYCTKLERLAMKQTFQLISFHNSISEKVL